MVFPNFVIRMQVLISKVLIVRDLYHQLWGLFSVDHLGITLNENLHGDLWQVGNFSQNNVDQQEKCLFEALFWYAN